MHRGGEYSYGTAYWTESTELEATCKKYGIAYIIEDEGRYEHPGDRHEWSPGQPDRVRHVLPGGSIALSTGQVLAMWREAGEDHAAFGRAVAAYFDIASSTLT